MKKQINVVGAIIENDNGEILCALRSKQMSLPNLWEFPGGKIEPAENLDNAIVREIQEELLCNIEFISKFHENTYEYKDFIVNLVTVKCRLVSSIPTATEHAKIIWLKREYLLSLNWAPADVPALHLLCNEEF